MINTHTDVIVSHYQGGLRFEAPAADADVAGSARAKAHAAGPSQIERLHRQVKFILLPFLFVSFLPPRLV